MTSILGGRFSAPPPSLVPISTLSVSPRNTTLPLIDARADDEHSDGSEFSLLGGVSSGTPSIVSFSSSASLNSNNPSPPHTTEQSPMISASDLYLGGADHGTEGEQGQKSHEENLAVDTATFISLLSRATLRRNKESSGSTSESPTSGPGLPSVTSQQSRDAVDALSDAPVDEGARSPATHIISPSSVEAPNQQPSDPPVHVPTLLGGHQSWQDPRESLFYWPYVCPSEFTLPPLRRTSTSVDEPSLEPLTSSSSTLSSSILTPHSSSIFGIATPKASDTAIPQSTFDGAEQLGSQIPTPKVDTTVCYHFPSDLRAAGVYDWLANSASTGSESGDDGTERPTSRVFQDPVNYVDFVADLNLNSLQPSSHPFNHTLPSMQDSVATLMPNRPDNGTKITPGATVESDTEVVVACREYVRKRVDDDGESMYARGVPSTLPPSLALAPLTIPTQILPAMQPNLAFKYSGESPTHAYPVPPVTGITRLLNISDYPRPRVQPPTSAAGDFNVGPSTAMAHRIGFDPSPTSEARFEDESPASTGYETLLTREDGENPSSCAAPSRYERFASNFRAAFYEATTPAVYEHPSAGPSLDSPMVQKRPTRSTEQRTAERRESPMPSDAPTHTVINDEVEAEKSNTVANQGTESPVEHPTGLDRRTNMGEETVTNTLFNSRRTYPAPPHSVSKLNAGFDGLRIAAACETDSEQSLSTSSDTESDDVPFQEASFHQYTYANVGLNNVVSVAQPPIPGLESDSAACLRRQGSLVQQTSRFSDGLQPAGEFNATPNADFQRDFEEWFMSDPGPSVDGCQNFHSTSSCGNTINPPGLHGTPNQNRHDPWGLSKVGGSNAQLATFHAPKSTTGATCGSPTPPRLDIGSVRSTPSLPRRVDPPMMLSPPFIPPSYVPTSDASSVASTSPKIVAASREYPFGVPDLTHPLGLDFGVHTSSYASTPSPVPPRATLRAPRVRIWKNRLSYPGESSSGTNSTSNTPAPALAPAAGIYGPINFVEPSFPPTTGWSAQGEQQHDQFNGWAPPSGSKRSPSSALGPDTTYDQAASYLRDVINKHPSSNGGSKDQAQPSQVQPATAGFIVPQPVPAHPTGLNGGWGAGPAWNAPTNWATLGTYAPQAQLQYPWAPWQTRPPTTLSRGMTGIPFSTPFLPPAPTFATASLPYGTASLPFGTSSLPQSGPTNLPQGPYPWDMRPPPAGYPTPGQPGYTHFYPWGMPPNVPPPLPNATHNTTEESGSRPGIWNPAPVPTPHARFSFSDHTVVFHVQSKEYRVHRHFFETHSVVFKEMLENHYDEERPLPLPDMTSTDFDRLLTIFYPLSLADPTELKTVEEWTSILKLSSQWHFTQLRLRAINELSPITSPVDRILLAQTYNIPEWNLAAYRELCLRGRPVTLEEGEKLGVKVVVKIWEVETELKARSHLCHGPCCTMLVESVVKAKFGIA